MGKDVLVKKLMQNHGDTAGQEAIQEEVDSFVSQAKMTEKNLLKLEKKRGRRGGADAASQGSQVPSAYSKNSSALGSRAVGGSQFGDLSKGAQLASDQVVADWRIL